MIIRMKRMIKEEDENTEDDNDVDRDNSNYIYDYSSDDKDDDGNDKDRDDNYDYDKCGDDYYDDDDNMDINEVKLILSCNNFKFLFISYNSSIFKKEKNDPDVVITSIKKNQV